MPVKPPEVVTSKDGLTAGLIDCARESSMFFDCVMARVTSNLKTSEMMRKGINPETVNALSTLWKARFEELTARAQEQGAPAAEDDLAVSGAFHHAVIGGGGGGAAASPNASAADWFDGESFDQTDGFGDERGDLARNVRPRLDADAAAAADDGDFTKQLLLMEQQEISDSDDADAYAIDTSNTIYCLHSYIRKQKVQKSKTKFKVALKDGIMSLNGVECDAAPRPAHAAARLSARSRYVFKQMDGTLLF